MVRLFFLYSYHRFTFRSAFAGRRAIDFDAVFFCSLDFGVGLGLGPGFGSGFGFGSGVGVTPSMVSDAYSSDQHWYNSLTLEPA